MKQQNVERFSREKSVIETISKPFDLHVLVCTNVRPLTTEGLLPDDKLPAPAKASCGPLGADLIRAELKSWLSEEMKKRSELNGKIKIRVNGSGCLDFCKKGIVIAIYPQSEFMFFVKNTSDSVALVKAKILAKLTELEKQIDC
jgi:(2Fe-2S) ferredoxin